MYQFNLNAILSYVNLLPSAIGLTLLLSIETIAISLILGMVGALGRSSKQPIVRFVATAYVEVFRNIPTIVLIYIVFFGVAQLGLRINNYYSALIALTLNASAYMTEIFRSGLIAVPHGQYIAAQSQGMTPFQLYRYVVIPQVIRVVYPPLGNQFVAVVIGSSLAAVIGVQELGNWMFSVGNDTFRYMESFLVAGFVYVALAQAINIFRIIVGRLLMRAPETR
ncbi:ABC transporter permease subunit [Agrobacterium vitis]|uniref:amino acid ABC transporter permease n=1 Tax=Rhizobium/Agrobacterium group TaxID=227290 RepID=UPI0012E8E0CF|nr:MULTISPECIES: amino acid ABC transporter permease [Rhizobium/Agrobacterium group]MCF1494355.1 amino acid ABC transporter permease [Allorhizobium ampelinum]MUZ66114.1 ABC transporter permease subunit [Agrobacterium vitis]MVA45861.1 ABC transporter permease subunit [Agrobacterium vitis]